MIDFWRVKAVRQRVWLVASALVFVGVLWKLTPIATSHAHRADGYAYLTQALEILGDQNPEPDFCVEGGIADPEAKALVGQAIEALEEARASTPAEAQTWLLLGRGYCLLGRGEEAVEAYERYTVLRPGNPLGHLELGFAYEMQGNFERANSEWQGIPLTQATFLVAGEKAREAGNFQQAIPWFQRAAFYFTEKAEASYQLGVTYQKSEHWEKALEAYDTAIAQSVFSNVTLGDIYYQKGIIFQTVPELTDLPQALEMYEAALATGAFSSNLIHANVYYKQGEIYLWMAGHLHEAMVDFEKAVALNPQHHLAHLRLGYTLYQIFQDVSLAESEILIAIELWPTQTLKSWPYRVLSEIYEEAGLPHQALMAIQEALLLDPEDAKAQISLERLQETAKNQP